MDFTNITDDENKISEQEGFKIFGYLRKKYGNNSVSHIDIILNSLCAALVRHGKCFVAPEDYGKYFDLINKILKNNLK
jgi:hypothetical protein